MASGITSELPEPRPPRWDDGLGINIDLHPRCFKLVIRVPSAADLVHRTSLATTPSAGTPGGARSWLVLERRQEALVAPEQGGGTRVSSRGGGA